jgi:uncharacterized protein (DUF488 family)
MSMLATIGYEGSSLDDFLATLTTAHVRTLIDVRELPISRRAGFAKKALSAALAGAGIEYVHLKGLGDPKPGREAARANDHKKFLSIYTAHLKTAAARGDLAEAVTLSENGGACLMCYERDPKTCHRRLVADEISAITGSVVRHLGVKDGVVSGKRRAEGASEWSFSSKLYRTRARSTVKRFAVPV